MEGLTQPGWPKYRKEGGLCRQCLPAGHGELFQNWGDAADVLFFIKHSFSLMFYICVSNKWHWHHLRSFSKGICEGVALDGLRSETKILRPTSVYLTGDCSPSPVHAASWYAYCNFTQLVAWFCVLAWVFFSCSLAVWGSSCLKSCDSYFSQAREYC